MKTYQEVLARAGNRIVNEYLNGSNSPLHDARIDIDTISFIYGVKPAKIKADITAAYEAALNAHYKENDIK